MSSNKSEIVLLPVRHNLAYKIEDGRKSAEFRKSNFPTHVKRAVIYATRPVSKIIGWVSISQVNTYTNPKLAWVYYSHRACISDAECQQYYGDAYTQIVLTLSSPVRFDHAFPVSFIDPKKRAPQSFRYLTEEEFDLAVVCGNHPVSDLRRDPITGRIMGL